MKLEVVFLVARLFCTMRRNAVTKTLTVFLRRVTACLTVGVVGFAGGEFSHEVNGSVLTPGGVKNRS